MRMSAHRPCVIWIISALFRHDVEKVRVADGAEDGQDAADADDGCGVCGAKPSITSVALRSCGGVVAGPFYLFIARYLISVSGFGCYSVIENEGRQDGIYIMLSGKGAPDSR